jgi:hypothetical protein
MKTLLGFDYMAGHTVELTRKQWRDRYADRDITFVQRDGETYVYGKTAETRRGPLHMELIAEVYAQGVFK